MSADPLFYPLDSSVRQDEWLDLDAMFQLPPEYLDSIPTSVESVSPRDLDQSFTDTDFLNWESDPAMCSQTMFPDFVGNDGYDVPVGELGSSVMDFQPFINPNDVLRQAPSFPNQFVDPVFENTCLPDAHDFSLFRDLVESQAALDPRCYSQKEKRRDASIALHLQRMQDELVSEMNTPSLSSNQLSSPDWSESSLEVTPECYSLAPTASTSTESQTTPLAGPQSWAAPMQLVLDLNMNATTNVPKKQKPRSKAQRENYIKARKYGVCEKHRKQHKRCNCVEKAAAAHLNANASRAIAGTPCLQTNHDRAFVNKSPQRSVQSPTGSAITGLPRPVRQPVETTKPDLSPTQPLAPLGRAQNTIRRRVNAANVGVPSPLNHPVRVTKPDLSPTQPLATSTRGQHVARQPIFIQKSNISSALSQIHASPTSHDRATAHITPQGAHTGGLLKAPALYRHKDGLNKQIIRIESGGEQIRQTIQVTGTQTTPGCRGMLKVHSLRAEDMPLTRRAGGIERQIIQTTWFAHISISLVQKASATIRSAAVGLLSHWQGLTTLSSAGHLLGRLAVSSSKLFLQFRKTLGMI
ncbi:predicted protein [Aspergillus nidulans FGSC A4]|uniref:Uncharacterized protein n=1 Tax=Emericella nidulans (strain FGSC A4 / ATCC 38163 / CBS 112.46 / NRRL 194 / M139) TaxID=227321 RepID=Q5B476_EMENI|nr:hypothetical protein [Aspergillus nidulans FGSC A4]EAA60456.1 predicted protein [Aspergillus nidulans FGSC A4]CBF77058.1 TPA: conserved hypothetical protein [Aspergillus nidulans FGSC A4]|eukprot:XP_662258.1 predicted protein [Aspergillus nidulans FGSC A4]